MSVLLLTDEASKKRTSAVRVHDFQAIYDVHFDFVWRVLMRFGVPRRNVEDAAQEVFFIVHRKLPEFEGRSSVRTWIFGIAMRVAKDFRRRFLRKEDHEPLPEAFDVEGSSDPHHLVERKEAAAILETFLATLDEDRRSVFVLAELEDFSAPEIAETLGVNLNTVYSRLRLGRRDFETHVTRLLARQGRQS